MGEAEMKAKIEALLLENTSLREKSSTKTPASSDIPPPWNPSPIQPAGEPVEDPSQDNPFGAEDTFDESMFLPNVDDITNKTIEIQETGENNKTVSSQSINTRRMTRSMNRNSTPQTDENSKTPSKTPS